MKKPPWVTNEPIWLQQCADVVTAANDVLSSTKCLTENARTLSTLGYRLRASQGPSFTVFRNLAAETESFPVGLVRANWSQRALPAIDAERSRVETRFMPKAMEAAQRLVAEYGLVIE